MSYTRVPTDQVSRHIRTAWEDLTMGIPRPSLNILIQEVGWGPGNRIVSAQDKSSTAGSRTHF